MFVEEFLTRFNADHENSISEEQKIRWLRHIELLVMSEIMHQHDEFDKRGIENEVIHYSRKDLPARITEDGHGLDISDIPEMYINGNELVMTGYEPTMGDREADNFDNKTFLQIPEPYDTVYEFYLLQRIALANGNTQEYNRYSALYNEAFRSFHKYWNRTHPRDHYRTHLLRHEVL